MLRLRMGADGGWQTGPQGIGRSAYVCVDCQSPFESQDAKVAGVFSRAFRRPVSREQMTALRQDILCHQR